MDVRNLDKKIEEVKDERDNVLKLMNPEFVKSQERENNWLPTERDCWHQKKDEANKYNLQITRRIQKLEDELDQLLSQIQDPTFVALQKKENDLLQVKKELEKTYIVEKTKMENRHKQEMSDPSMWPGHP